MDFYKVPIGFGLAMAGNTAAMNRYAQFSDAQKQEIRRHARIHFKKMRKNQQTAAKSKKKALTT